MLWFLRSLPSTEGVVGMYARGSVVAFRNSRRCADIIYGKTGLKTCFFSLGVGKYCFLSLCLQLTRLCFCGIIL